MLKRKEVTFIDSKHAISVRIMGYNDKGVNPELILEVNTAEGRQLHALKRDNISFFGKKDYADTIIRNYIDSRSVVVIYRLFDQMAYCFKPALQIIMNDGEGYNRVTWLIPITKEHNQYKRDFTTFTDDRLRRHVFK